jgi:hypothetical protein
MSTADDSFDYMDNVPDFTVLPDYNPYDPGDTYTPPAVDPYATWGSDQVPKDADGNPIPQKDVTVVTPDVTPGGSDWAKNILGKAATPAGIASLMALAGSLLGMNKPSASPGWKGVIDPNAYVANRAQIEQPKYEPYSGKPVMGGRQFTDVSYSKPSEAAPAQTVNGVPLADFLAKKGIGGLPKDFGPKEDDQAGPFQPMVAYLPENQNDSGVSYPGGSKDFDESQSGKAAPLPFIISPSGQVQELDANGKYFDKPTGFEMPGFTNTETGGGMAMGGVAGLAHGGRYLHGKTDGMADKLDTTIDGTQAAKLSHGEFVIPADVVSHLGNGNSTAGADVLYKMMDRVRKARTGNPKQGKQINPEKFMPGGLASLPTYANGGAIAFAAGDVVSAPGVTSNSSGGPTLPSTNESNLSSWAGPGIADYIQRGTAIAKEPYQAYTGPLTAGTSPLQQQAFTAAGNLSVPASIGQAATAAGDVGAKMGAMSYTPTTSTNQFTAPGAYQAANNANQYTATSPYDAANVTTGTFGTQQAQQYMNPYLQASLDPQLAEARRQSQITQMSNNAQAAKAGAFGGSRGALMNTETQRNLGTNLANITGQGYNTAYTTGQTQFNADQARQLQAQQQSEQSRQFGAGQALSNAQNAAQYGLAGLNANEASRQFGAGQAMTSAQQQAQYGNLAQTQNEQAKQYANTFGLSALQDQLGAINAQGQFGNMQNQAGIANLNALTSAGATQRGIEAENVAAQKAAFEEERGAPMAGILATQKLYQGLPVSTVTSSTATTPAQQIAETAGQVKNVYNTVDKLVGP